MQPWSLCICLPPCPNDCMNLPMGSPVPFTYGVLKNGKRKTGPPHITRSTERTRLVGGLMSLKSPNQTPHEEAVSIIETLATRNLGGNLSAAAECNQCSEKLTINLVSGVFQRQPGETRRNSAPRHRPAQRERRSCKVHRSRRQPCSRRERP